MIDKNKYKFIDPNNKDASFDRNKLNEYINNNQYEEAWNYGINLTFTNPNDQQEWIDYLDKLRFEGIKKQQLYENTDESKRDAIDFYENFLEPGGLERIPNNPYAQKAKDIKNDMLNGNSKFRIEFQPKEQKLFGWDWLKRDNNKKNIQSFYDKTNFSKSYLESQGIKVGKENGRDYLEFDASNDLANTILINTFSERDGTDYLPYLYTVDDNGNKKKPNYYYNSENSNRDVNKYLGLITNEYAPEKYDSRGYYHYLPTTNLYALQQLYEDAKKESTIAYEEIIPSERQYGSKIFANKIASIAELDQALVSGDIKTSDHKYRSLKALSDLVSGLAQTENFGQYQIWYDENDEGTNREISDVETKKELYDLFTASTRDVHIGTVITGNKVGIHLTIPAKLDENGNIKRSAKSFTVFGKDIEQKVQSFVNNDPQMRAWRETLALEEIGHNYTTWDNKTYKVDTYGRWFENDKPINATQDDIQKIIRKDIDIKNNVRDIVYANVNHNNEIIDNNLFEAQLKYAAFSTASHVNNIDFVKALTPILGANWNSGTNQLEILNKVFQFKGLGSVISDDYVDKIPQPLYGPLTELFEIYDNMIARSKQYIGN